MQAGNASTHRSAINVTPLIDVLLVLLIIFMVIQPTTLRGLEAIMPHPPKDQRAEADPQTLVLQVRSGVHEPVYTLNGSTIALADLPFQLGLILAPRANKVLFVQGDAALDYASIASALDIARRSGAEDIGLLTPHSF